MMYVVWLLKHTHVITTKGHQTVTKSNCIKDEYSWAKRIPCPFFGKFLTVSNMCNIQCTWQFIFFLNSKLVGRFWSHSEFILGLAIRLANAGKLLWSNGDILAGKSVILNIQFGWTEYQIVTIYETKESPNYSLGIFCITIGAQMAKITLISTKT